MNEDTNEKVRTLSSSPAAVRMRRYRKEHLPGLRWIRMPIDVSDINAFIRLGLMKEDQRQDDEAVRTAVMSLVYDAGDRARQHHLPGLRWIRMPIDLSDIDAFIRLGLMKKDQRQDDEAVRTAVMSLVYKAGDRVTPR